MQVNKSAGNEIRYAPGVSAPAADEPSSYRSEETEDNDETATDDLPHFSSPPALSPPKARPSFVPPLQQAPAAREQDASSLEPTQFSDRPTMDGASDAIAWLYEQAKAAFEAKRFDEALDLFEAALAKLRDAHVRVRGSEEGWNPAATGYRNLDDYLDLCRTRRHSFVVRQQQQPPPPSLTPQASATGSHVLGAVDLARSSSSDLLAATSSSSSSSSTAMILPKPPPILNRSTLIFVCSPRAMPLTHLADEAVDVANVTPSHIRRGGSAEDLRAELMKSSYEHFLFAGHGDAPLGPPSANGGLSASSRTLGFTSPTGGLEVVQPEHLASLLGAHSPRTGGLLTTVFLNGCETYSMGARVRAAGVPYVVCWRTKAESGAARLFACSFFSSLVSGRGHLQAFEDAKSALLITTRPGNLANGLPSSVPAYELRDPFPSPPSSSSSSSTAPSTGAADPYGFKPKPMAAGIPELLCAETEPGEPQTANRI